jgi:hypothetical protein
MEDLQSVEHICRKDPKVIEQCVISGIPVEDMHKVYCDRKLDCIFCRWPFTYSIQLGRLVTITVLEAMFDYNKHSCITDRTWMTANIRSPSTSAQSLMLGSRKSFISIFQKYADLLIGQNPTTTTLLLSRRKEVTEPTSNQSTSHSQRAFPLKWKAELLIGRIGRFTLVSTTRRVSYSTTSHTTTKEPFVQYFTGFRLRKWLYHTVTRNIHIRGSTPSISESMAEDT